MRRARKRLGAIMPTELELDHLFWNALRTNSDFFAWFIGKSKFGGHCLELRTDELWHQRWYRNPETKKESETDITLFLRDCTSGSLFSIHLENKTPHRAWEEGQAEGYRVRALNRMSHWGHADCQVALLAPQSHIASHPLEVSHFDFCVSYEEVGIFVPEFRAACM